MSRLKLSILFTSFIHALSQAVVCIRAPALLPTVSDCTTIVEAIGWLSRMHGENTMRAWGRRLPTTADTQKVPKVFWISGRGPTTCAVHVDVDAYHPWAVDDFRLSDVAAAGEQVVAQCLISRGKIGLAYPAGMDGHVYAKVISSAKLTACVSKKHYTISLMIKNHSNRVANTDNFCGDCEDRFALRVEIVQPVQRAGVCNPRHNGDATPCDSQSNIELTRLISCIKHHNEFGTGRLRSGTSDGIILLPSVSVSYTAP